MNKKQLHLQKTDSQLLHFPATLLFQCIKWKGVTTQTANT